MDAFGFQTLLNLGLFAGLILAMLGMLNNHKNNEILEVRIETLENADEINKMFLKKLDVRLPTKTKVKAKTTKKVVAVAKD